MCPNQEIVFVILKLKAPTDTTKLRQVIEMVNQLGKFFSNSDYTYTQPFWELLSIKRSQGWGPKQAKLFSQVKKELTRPKIRTPYNQAVSTKISAGASSYGLGWVLLQQNKSSSRWAGYAWRAMSETEKLYVQIVKEALAVTWTCDIFHNYILGRQFEIETDYKPPCTPPDVQASQ